MSRDVIVRNMQPGDEPAVSEVIKRAFKNPAATAHPLPPDRFVIIAELDGAIVGHVSIRPMLFHVNGAIERGNVLHMVATDPACQRRGIGLKMLDGVVEVLARERMAVSLLETPVPGFYAARGWVPLAPRGVLGITREQVDAMVVRFGSPRDLAITDVQPDQVAEHASFHERHVPRDVLAAVRNEPYMRGVIEKHAGGVIAFCHRIARAGHLAGQVFGERAGNVKPGEPLTVSVQSWIMDRVAHAEIAAVLSHLLDFDEEFSKVQVNMPVEAMLHQAIIDAGGTLEKCHGNIDMALWTRGPPGNPAGFRPDYDQGLFQAYLADMGIS